MSKPWSGVLASARGLEFQGNIRVLAVTSMSTGTYVTMFNALLQPFVVKSLGFGVFVLGILVALGARPSGLASSIVQPFAGQLADFLGRKPLIVAGSVVGICSMASFVFAAITRSLLPLTLGFVFYGVALLGYPASQAAIAESVAMDPRKLQVAFSVVSFFTYLPGVIAPGIGGYVASAFGYAVLFGAAALLEVSNLLLLLTSFRETRQPKRGEGLPGHIRFSFKEALRIPPGFRRTFIPFAMDAFSYGLGGSIIYGLWTSAFGFTPTDIGLIAATLAASIVVSQYLSTRILLRAGSRRTLAFSEFLTVVTLAGWLASPTVFAALLMAVVLGFSVSTWVPSLSSLFMTAAPVEERGSISGKLAAFRGLVGTPAPFIGGYLFTSFGYYVPVALSLVGEAITTVALLKLLPRKI
jgi:MFS transporter, DHA1 family, tetracycline resistance protein